MGSDTFGWTGYPSMRSRGLLTSRFSFFWSTKPIAWDLAAGRSHNGAEVGRALASWLTQSLILFLRFTHTGVD